MNWQLFLLFLVPALIWAALGATFLRNTITAVEAFVQAVATVIILAIVMSLGSYLQVADTQIVNGRITELDTDRQNCPIGWQRTTDSFCTNYTTRSVYTGQSCSGSGKSRSCRSTYRTEYNYIYPWEQKYFIEHSVEQWDEIEIPRVDRQGAVSPPRWLEAKVGDPVSLEVTYTNYIKGAAASLFNQQFDEPANLDYPQVYDFYHIQRVFFEDYKGNTSVLRDWNSDLEEVNARLEKIGANAILIVTGQERSWAERLAQTWDAHNINDVVIVIGAEEGKIEWVDVRSWSKNELVNIKLRDAILDVGTVDPDAINAAVEREVAEHFKLQNMSAFEYLADDILPPTWVYVMAWLLLLIVNPLLTLLFHRTDFFQSNTRNRFV